MLIVRQKGSMLVDLIIGGFLGMLMMGVLFQVIAAIHIGRSAHQEGVRLALGAVSLQHYLDMHGVGIINNDSIPGFAAPYEPQSDELKAAGFMPQYLSTKMSTGGRMIFSVRRGANNDLLGLACNNKQVQKSGLISPEVAAKIVAATSGFGLMTSIADPSTLNGPAMQNVPSPIAGAAIVCAWAFLPNPI